MDDMIMRYVMYTAGLGYEQWCKFVWYIDSPIIAWLSDARRPLKVHTRCEKWAKTRRSSPTGWLGLVRWNWVWDAYDPSARRRIGWGRTRGENKPEPIDYTLTDWRLSWHNICTHTHDYIILWGLCMKWHWLLTWHIHVWNDIMDDRDNAGLGRGIDAMKMWCDAPCSRIENFFEAEACAELGIARFLGRFF